jgi:hypothetical protein
MLSRCSLSARSGGRPGVHPAIVADAAGSVSTTGRPGQNRTDNLRLRRAPHVRRAASRSRRIRELNPASAALQAASRSRRGMRQSTPSRTRTCGSAFGGRCPIRWTMGACVRRDGFEPPCPWDLVYSEARSTRLCHRRMGCPTRFELVSPRFTVESLSHLGQGTSSQRRNRTLVSCL